MKWLQVIFAVFALHSLWARAEFTGNLEGATLYEMLGVEEKATPEEIEKAYKKAARAFHPDANKDLDSTNQFNAVVRVFNILSHPEHRTVYNAFLKYSREHEKEIGRGEQQARRMEHYLKKFGTKDMDFHVRHMAAVMKARFSLDSYPPEDLKSTPPPPENPAVVEKPEAPAQPKTLLTDNSGPTSPNEKASTPNVPASQGRKGCGARLLRLAGIVGLTGGLVFLGGHELGGDKSLVNPASESADKKTSLDKVTAKGEATPAQKSQVTPPSSQKPEDKTPGVDTAAERGQRFRDKLKKK